MVVHNLVYNRLVCHLMEVLMEVLMEDLVEDLNHLMVAEGVLLVVVGLYLVVE